MQNRVNRFTKNLNNMTVRALNLSVVKIGKYQKKLNKTRAAAIAAEYDSHRMRPIDVSYRDNEFWCFDGQTRLEAYKIMGYTHIPAIIHEGLTYEDEAFLFARQQDNVGSVLSSHKWNALVEAGDPATLKTIEIVTKNNFKISGSVSSPNTIAAVKTAQDIVIESGFEGLDKTLSVLDKAWNGKDVYNRAANRTVAPTNVTVIEGVYNVIKAYKNDPKFSEDRLVHCLAATNPTQLMCRANDFRVGRASVRMAVATLEAYNKGLRSENKLTNKFKVM